MTVIDLRDELYKRQIELIEITDDCVYYAEEMNVQGIDTIYLYCYSFLTGKEQIMTYFAFDDATYLQHYYACKDSIIILFENDGSRVWIVKVDKKTNNEVFRKKITLIGRFFDCIPIDDNNIIIYSKADDDSRELFNRCLEETNCDTLANLYDLELSYRYFIKDFKTAMLIKNNMHKFTDKNGNEHMILCDPYCNNEKDKEELSKELGRMTEDIRDNIWEISKKRLLDGIKGSKEKVGLRKIASAGSEGIVRFECISSDKIIFRAKIFSTGQEQFFEMSTADGRVEPVCKVRKGNNDSRYFTDTESGKIYYVVKDGESAKLIGEINSSAEITYPCSIGRIESCIDDRFIIANSMKSYNEPSMSIYDGRLNLTDTYQARVKVKDDVLVFY